MWASTITRSDIADAVRTVAMFGDKPGSTPGKAVVKMTSVSASDEGPGPQVGRSKSERTRDFVSVCGL